MNKVKFRAYDDFEKKIYDIIEISFEKKEVVALFRGGLRNRYEIDELMLLPFIGLHDKNQNEIYEGDLLKKDEKEYIVLYDEKTAHFIARNKFNKQETEPLINLIHRGFIVDGCGLI